MGGRRRLPATGCRAIAEPALLPYVYRLAPPTGHYELAALEFQALTGADAPAALPWDRQEDHNDVPRFARAGAGVDVARSAYIAECVHVLTEADTLDEMLAATGRLGLRRERFRIRVHKSGYEAPVSSNEIARTIADLIDGAPDLSRPVTEFVVFGSPRRWLLGESVSRGLNAWHGHEQRPFQYSSALPPRVARAMVNLVALPGDRLIDPCCGVATVLVEAAEMGVEPFGWEINRPVAEHAAANLCHHTQQAWLTIGDGRDARGRWDGAVLDLPYGHAAVRVQSECLELVEHALKVAQLAAIVTVDDLRDFLEGLGAAVLGVAELPKNNLVRRVHWVRSPL